MTSNKTLAVQTFHALAAADSGEMERVEKAVGLELYEGPCREYQDWLAAFKAMSSLWAIEHWRMLAQLFAAQSGVAEYRDKDPVQAANFAHSVAVFGSRYAALEIALDRVCDAHALRSDVVRILAGTEEPIELRQSYAPDLDYLRDLMGDMERTLPRPHESQATH